MKYMVAVVVLSGGLVWAVGSARAEEAKPGAVAAGAVKVEGVVVSTNARINELVIKQAKGGNMKVFVGDKVEIRSGGRKDIPLQFLRAGRELTVAYQVVGQNNVAQWIELKPRKPAEAEKAKVIAPKK
jgi:hypothetical protein